MSANGCIVANAFAAINAGISVPFILFGLPYRGLPCPACQKRLLSAVETIAAHQKCINFD
jgi:hypothetical protein